MLFNKIISSKETINLIIICQTLVNAKLYFSLYILKLGYEICNQKYTIYDKDLEELMLSTTAPHEYSK